MVGQRVCALLAASDDVEEVIAIDRASMRSLSSSVTVVRRPLADADLEAIFAGVDVVCHLASNDPLEGTAPDHDLRITGRVLDAVAACGVGHLIVRTTAAVYGAWPDNPVPLTEAALLRPNPDCPWARMRVEVEDKVSAFAATHPGTVVSVLRPVVTVSPSGPDELGRVLAATRRLSSAEDDARVQFVHADDVASAVDVVRRTGAEGVFNVAPTGSIDTGRVRALLGAGPRLRLPGWMARPLRAMGWRYGLAPTAPGFASFVSYPWVVASDRLRSLGWEAAHTNDEAFVEGHEATPWSQISPQRRQEIALAGSAVALTGVLGGLAWYLRRRFR